MCRVREGYSKFLFGNDVFVSLPTGYSKLLCFGLLPYVFDALRGVEKKSIVLAVCPLVALMKEHVNFSSMGIPAAYIISTTSTLACLTWARALAG